MAKLLACYAVLAPAGLERMLLRNPSYSMHTLLEGVGTVLHSLVQRMRGDSLHLLGALQPLAAAPQDRAVMAQALEGAVKVTGWGSTD